MPPDAELSRYLFVFFVFLHYVYQSLMRGWRRKDVHRQDVLLNLGLDPLFIFGWRPIPRWCRRRRDSSS
jgi:hypothetical protein